MPPLNFALAWIFFIERRFSICVFIADAWDVVFCMVWSPHPVHSLDSKGHILFLQFADSFAHASSLLERNQLTSRSSEPRPLSSSALGFVSVFIVRFPRRNIPAVFPPYNRMIPCPKPKSFLPVLTVVFIVSFYPTISEWMDFVDLQIS